MHYFAFEADFLATCRFFYSNKNHQVSWEIRALKIYNPDKIGERDDEFLKNQQSFIPITSRADRCHQGLLAFRNTVMLDHKESLCKRMTDKTGCAGVKGDQGGDDKLASDHQLQQPAFARKCFTNN